jgi:hypothetical protein
MAPGLLVIALIIIGVLVFGGIALVSGGRFSSRQGDVQAEAKAGTDMLRYHVPEGWDPAMVLAALQKEGFEAVPDLNGSGATQDLLIPCRDGVERHRAHVRAVIESAEQANFMGDLDQLPQVRFADEMPGT